TFFEPSLSPPAQTVLHEKNAFPRYQQKRQWQLVHKPLCQAVPAICGNQFAFFRSRQTGAYTATGGTRNDAPVSYDPVVEQTWLETQQSGREFRLDLHAKRGCVVFTLVPTVKPPRAAASTLASALKVDFIAPDLDNLNTFDGSHLDVESAERWSK